MKTNLKNQLIEFSKNYDSDKQLAWLSRPRQGPN